MQLLSRCYRTLHREIDTPALLVDTVQMEKNISEMQRIAGDAGVDLRPHCKTHKSVQIALRQIQAGAIGITVAKLGEAEVMAEAGIDNIFIANQITHPLKVKRLFRLHRQCQVSVGLDHPDQIRLLSQLFINPRHPLEILIEIDCGFHRCGVVHDKNLLKLAQMVKKAPGLKLKGIFTHAGQVYGADDHAGVRMIGKHEGACMADTAGSLKSAGIVANVVSVGSTPTAPFAADNPSVTEIRPGNYVFYDQIQVSLGVCTEAECALGILATVIAQPDIRRIVVDAGSKALNLDRGAHAKQTLSGYGHLVSPEGEIVRLSEEHGVIELARKVEIPIGSPVLIIPNHACAVTNLFDHYYFIGPAGKWNKSPVDARGCSV